MVNKKLINELCIEAVQTDAAARYIETFYTDAMTPMDVVNIAHVFTSDLVKAMVTVYHIGNQETIDQIIRAISEEMLSIMFGAMMHGLE